MGQALYRKYRSRSLAEIVGQEHVTETLKRAIDTGKVSHAYLFTGPRGVGKTSIARILAHELNAVAYDGEDSYLDIIEIDAASNGGVEEVRSLREKVHIAPSSGKYKVYIIDEVHMMTTAAFNALLKTLEEPPAHAVFILATTEAHKVPATIVSRTQRYTFRPIPVEKMIAHLRFIADQEKIDVTDDAFMLIAEHSEGSFRDAIGMLDQASSNSEVVSGDSVQQLLGIPPASRLATIIQTLATNDISALAAELTDARQNGYQAGTIAKQLAQRLRHELVEGTSTIAPHIALKLLARLIDVPASARPEQLLEIVLFETVIPNAPTAPRVASVASASAQHDSSPVVPPRPSEPTTPPAAKPKPVTRTDQPPADDITDGDGSTSPYLLDAPTWQRVLDSMKKEYNTLYGIVRMARTDFSPGKVTLTFGFAFHQKRANDPKNKKIITSAIETLTGQKVALNCAFDAAATPSPFVATAASAPDLTAVSAIFGGGEIIQT